jgi:uncharacterized phiE125 gp8 family phage protein
MSNITFTVADLAVLPAGLLPIAKSHLRVEGTYDDAYITMTIARAINWFQRATNVSVNPVTWVWTPAEEKFCGGIATVPVTPVSGMTVADADDADITADYSLITMSTHGVMLYGIEGSYLAGMAVTLPSGYATFDLIDPGITDAVLRYTAHLYENREILVPGTDAQTPGWMTDVISTYWVPRA